MRIGAKLVVCLASALAVVSSTAPPNAQTSITMTTETLAARPGATLAPETAAATADVEPANVLKQTPFADWLDYATWLQYACELLMRAGASDELDTALSRLLDVSRNLDEDDAHAVRDTYWRLQSRAAEWKRLAGSVQPGETSADADAAKIMDFLLAGRYGAAKDVLRAQMDGRDYATFAPGLKRAMVAVGLVQWDAMAPGAILPLWAPDWALSADDKIAALIRARQLRRRAEAASDASSAPAPQDAPAFRPFDKLPMVDARVLAALGRDATALFDAAGVRDDAAERDLLRAQMAAAQGEACIAKDLVEAATRLVSTEWARADLRGVGSRLGERCARAQQDATYRAFCQSSSSAAFPVAEAAAAASVDEDTQTAIQTEERMFWTRLAAGDCELADHALREVRRVLPVAVMAARPYLARRFAHMDARLAACVRTPNLYVNTFGHRLMDALRRGAFGDALRLWRDNFAYNPTSSLASVWRRAILVARYPKATYAPCMGNALLASEAAPPENTPEADSDRELLNRLATIMAGEDVPPCAQATSAERDACNLLWMKAFYAADMPARVLEYGALLPPGPPGYLRDEAHALRACTKLCSPGGSARDACRALDAYGRMAPSAQEMPQNRIGFGLAKAICAGAAEDSGIRQPGHLVTPAALADPFYVRDGLYARPLGSLFRAYLRAELKRPLAGFVPRSSFVHERASSTCAADDSAHKKRTADKAFRMPFTPNDAEAASLLARKDSVHAAFERFLRVAHPRATDAYAEAAGRARGDKERLAQLAPADGARADAERLAAVADAEAKDGNERVLERMRKTADAVAAAGGPNGSAKDAGDHPACLKEMIARFPFLAEFFPPGGRTRSCKGLSSTARTQLLEALSSMKSHCERDIVEDIMRRSA